MIREAWHRFVHGHWPWWTMDRMCCDGNAREQRPVGKAW